MQIGVISTKSGASCKAIRHYEEIGLLRAVARVGSYRRYTDSDLQFVKLIRQAQAVGFGLAELQGVRLASGGIDWPAIAQRIQARKAAVAREIAALRARSQQLLLLEAELATCDETTRLPACLALDSAPRGKA